VKRVFVTGATGFIGAAVVRRLIAEGCEVSALIRPESSTWRLGEAARRVHVVHGSLEAPETFARAMAEFAPDTVMHLAWHGVRREHRDAPDQIRKNVVPSVDLLLTAAQAGCRTFVGAGSQAEYGPSQDVLCENSPTRPTTAYGAAKLATYVLLRQRAAVQAMRFAWLRLFSVYGPMDDGDTLVGYVCTELLAGRTPVVRAGDLAWDSLYIDDAATAFVAVGNSQATGAINVASGEAPPLRDTILRLRDAVDPSLPVSFDAATASSAGGFPLRANIDRLQALDWAPTTCPREAAVQTVAWYRQNAAS
jgi:UDP-glucose 4-epimerase